MTGAIEIRDLTVSGPAGVVVQPLDLDLHVGETVALIGESGSGKTLTAKSLIGLLPNGFGAQGQMTVSGRTVPLAQRDTAWRALRGRTVSLLLQDPFTSLSPVHRCGEQIGWTLDAVHGRLGRRERSRRVAAQLAEVQLPERVATAYPHELSGGMRQRVAIAAALASDPVLLIADEPTTALDASNQAEILDLLNRLQVARGMSLLLISHDLALVRGRADRVLVMRAGEVVEQGPTPRVLFQPQHAYTQALIAADPALGDPPAVGARPTSDAVALVTTAALVKSFGSRTVLDEVSIDIPTGTVVGIVGESGSGKSTLARCIAGLEREDGGEIRFDGAALAPGRASRTRDQMQIVFQDPYSSLNPMMTVGAILREALATVGRPSSEVPQLLEQVGLPAAFDSKRPAQLSGGQRQRVAIARALAPQPRLLICDESVSALDVSVQAQVLDLLVRLRSELGLTILFISHDLAVVRRIADTVAVLWNGKVVEHGPCSHVLGSPTHPYTQSLLAGAAREKAGSASLLHPLLKGTT